MTAMTKDEDHTMIRPGRLPAFLFSRRLVLVALVCFACATTASDGIVPAGDSPGDFQAEVADVSGTTQEVSVPLNRSAIINTSIEVARADVVTVHVADVQPISPTQLLITGKNYGETDVVLWDKADQQYLLKVSVELDLERLSEALKRIDPLSTVVAKSVMGNIVLTGRVTSIERARRMEDVANLFLPSGGEEMEVQNHLDVSGEDQVLLRCVVAEVSRGATRELGVNGFLAGDNVRDAFLVNQLGGINPINMGAAADALVNQRIPFLTGTDGIPLGEASSISLGFPRLQMQLFIRAMADNSLLAVLAEPNLVAISGQTATFLAGGEFPIPVPQGNQTVTIDFKKYGVELNFTPLVLGQQVIRLKVNPVVSELDFSNAAQFQGFVIPGVTKRSAETTVEVGAGQTIAIAGLLSENVRGFASRVPGIGDVPILGALFRSVSFRKSQSELVILVTPEIVAPLDAHQMAHLPGHDIKPPSNFELYALGLTEANELEKKGGEDETSESSEPDEMSIHGPWGHAKPASTQ
ncbi:MAG: type II and III secretion system protein family protein [Phycisphaerales bacterium]|nr:MAG: type II and III secretion system protein family protein [Phycisphaerales bacterium]